MEGSTDHAELASYDLRSYRYNATMQFPDDIYISHSAIDS